ncbi:hypothetical protein NDU88_004031 [Pleurodeles waltl]|uniref:Uncharacterized protein n=1 Tax=Pleurodeles waltl TaxID=8319 RepID=A0AAV7KWK1_PLEWA|nr:hypothetical protein NDU88_004031 [Pleurodeles waltl]
MPHCTARRRHPSDCLSFKTVSSALGAHRANAGKRRREVHPRTPREEKSRTIPHTHRRRQPAAGRESTLPALRGSKEDTRLLAGSEKQKVFPARSTLSAQRDALHRKSAAQARREFTATHSQEKIKTQTLG